MCTNDMLLSDLDLGQERRCFHRPRNKLGDIRTLTSSNDATAESKNYHKTPEKQKSCSPCVYAICFPYLRALSEDPRVHGLRNSYQSKIARHGAHKVLCSQESQGWPVSQTLSDDWRRRLLIFTYSGPKFLQSDSGVTTV